MLTTPITVIHTVQNRGRADALECRSSWLRDWTSCGSRGAFGWKVDESGLPLRRGSLSFAGLLEARRPPSCDVLMSWEMMAKMLQALRKAKRRGTVRHRTRSTAVERAGSRVPCLSPPAAMRSQRHSRSTLLHPLLLCVFWRLADCLWSHCCPCCCRCPGLLSHLLSRHLSRHLSLLRRCCRRSCEEPRSRETLMCPHMFEISLSCRSNDTSTVCCHCAGVGWWWPSTCWKSNLRSSDSSC
jgi:hypothetical protein